MEVRKAFFLRSKLGLRYDALLELLTDPDFCNEHGLVGVVSPLGEDSWVDEIIEEFKGMVE
jgi:hypothetical protein